MGQMGMMNPQMMSQMGQMGMMNPQMMGMNTQMMNPQMGMNPAMVRMIQQQQQQQMMAAGPSLSETLRQTHMQPPGTMAPGAPPESPTPSPVPGASACTPPVSPQTATRKPSQSERAKFDDDDDDEEEEVVPKKAEPFKLYARNLSLNDEWSKRLPEMQKYDWQNSPVHMIPLTPDDEKMAEELLASHAAKDIDAFGATIMSGAPPETAYNLFFGYPGSQVPVEQDLKQKIILSLNDVQKTSFKIPKRKYPKFRITAEPSEGTLAKGQNAIEITLTLRMTCTTSVELQVPIIFWHGTLKDFEKITSGEKTEGLTVYTCYLQGKMQSQLSTRLDIEEVMLFRPAIGSGAFGTVYRGRYRGLDVACKLLKDQDDLTQEMYDDFRGEVNMFETLRHPCIVNFVGAVFFPGSLALVTELCQYGSLPSAMKKYGPKVWNTDMKIKSMFDCARAMDFLHQSSIIHRDLKPDNLLATSLEVHSPAVCKLSDFGTTKGANSMMRDMKMTKGIGTPLYMAPEMMRGIGGYTTKADVYSFGIMMASVTDDGAEPYQGDSRIQSSWQFTNLVIQGLRPIVAKAKEMPPTFLKLMQKCWQADPNLRPSFDQIVTELESMLPE